MQIFQLVQRQTKMITIHHSYFGKNLLLKKENVKVDFGLCHAFTIVDTHTYKCHDLKNYQNAFIHGFPENADMTLTFQ